jgi:hypothetical protein
MKLALLSLLLAVPAVAQEAKPIKALLITGGCCHDYKAQKDILKKGLEKRLNIEVTQMHVDDNSKAPKLPLYGNADYAKGFDVVIHDECAGDVNDPAIVDAVLKPHRDGIPGVNLHCAVHAYRSGDRAKVAEKGEPRAAWFEYLGLQSPGHGAQKPIAVTYLPDTSSPITKGLADWKTSNDELYWNLKIWDSAKPLAKGKQEPGDANTPGGIIKNDCVVVWTNEYGEKKTRVFTTSLGHNNTTVDDDRYLDLVARGLLWSLDKINDDGTPKAGYGTKSAP